MTLQEKAKRYVNAICVGYTRGTLEWVAEECGYKNTHKINRSKLEKIAYINGVFLGDGEHYCIIDNTTEKPVVKRCCRKYVIDYVMRECWCEWYKECIKPIIKNTTHTIKIVEVK